MSYNATVCLPITFIVTFYILWINFSIELFSTFDQIWENKHLNTVFAQRKDQQSKLWIDIYSIDGSKKCRGDDLIVIWNYWPGTMDMCYGDNTDTAYYRSVKQRRDGK